MINCCTGGGGGGTCPPGQYWRTVKECRQACNAGWVPAGGCQPACSATKDCCQKTGCFSCGITAPSNVTATSLTETAARLDWTPGTGGNSQRLYLDESESAVANNCVEGCTLYETGLDPALASFDTGDVLLPNTTYYYKIKIVETEDCSMDVTGSWLHWPQASPSPSPTPPVEGPWWQVEDGSLHADNGGIRSLIPATCTGSCVPALITQSAAGATTRSSFLRGSTSAFVCG